MTTVSQLVTNQFLVGHILSSQSIRFSACECLELKFDPFNIGIAYLLTGSDENDFNFDLFI